MVDYTKTNLEKDPSEYIQLVTQLAEEYYRIRDQISKLDAKKKEIGQEILRIVGPGTTMKLEDGLTVVTVDETVQNRFNSTKFRKDYPDLASEYLTESRVSAQTRISGKLLDE